MKNLHGVILLVLLTTWLPLPCARAQNASADASAEERTDLDIRLDQANVSDAGAGWTNLVNHAVQTFTPSLPKLVRVEVALMEANPGPKKDVVTLTILGPDGKPLAVAERALSAAQTGWVPFLFPEGGIAVTPGKVYGIEVNGSTRFGWRYVGKGYGKGEALFNGKPLLKGAHSSFLFKTFGSS